jgi:Leu/Phe-tRNA-protein transferase
MPPNATAAPKQQQPPPSPHNRQPSSSSSSSFSSAKPLAAAAASTTTISTTARAAAASGLSPSSASASATASSAALDPERQQGEDLERVKGDPFVEAETEAEEEEEEEEERVLLLSSLASIDAYIPEDLKSAVRPYYGDFCYSFSFHPQLIVQLMAEGFLPIAGAVRCAPAPASSSSSSSTLTTTTSPSSSSTTRRRHVLLPKLHQDRCVIPLTTEAKAAVMAVPATRTTRPSTATTSPDEPSAASHNKNKKRPRHNAVPTLLPPSPRLHSPSDDGPSSPSPPPSPSPPSPSHLLFRVHKSTRKRSRKYFITCNTAWEQVVDQCQRQHGVSSWLYPPLVDSLTTLFRHSHQQQDRNCPFATVRANIDDDDEQDDEEIHVPVRLYSIEVWKDVVQDGDDERKEEDEQEEQEDDDKGKDEGDDNKNKKRHRRKVLVAGELGYTVGAVYTSLTGFARESGAGSVQLAALGRWLQQSKFRLWDLGMEMEYKADMGAVLVPRHRFVQAVHEWRRPPHGDLVLTMSGGGHDDDDDDGDDGGRMNCRDVIDSEIVAPSAAARET